MIGDPYDTTAAAFGSHIDPHQICGHLQVHLHHSVSMTLIHCRRCVRFPGGPSSECSSMPAVILSYRLRVPTLQSNIIVPSSAHQYRTFTFSEPIGETSYPARRETRLYPVTAREQVIHVPTSQ